MAFGLGVDGGKPSHNFMSWHFFRQRSTKKIFFALVMSIYSLQLAGIDREAIFWQGPESTKRPGSPLDSYLFASQFEAHLESNLFSVAEGIDLCLLPPSSSLPLVADRSPLLAGICEIIRA